MITANAFRASGFSVDLSHTYDDPETSERREIDVTAARRVYPKGPYLFEISFKVECKASRDKPWVVFTDKPYPRSSFPDSAICSNVWSTVTYSFRGQNDVNNHLQKLPLFDNVYTGYSLTQAFTSGQDVCYKALMSCVKASEASVQEYDRSILSKHLYLVGVAIPVIVIDCPLFLSWIYEDGELKISEIERAVVNWSRTTAEKSCDVHIVSKDSLQNFVKYALQSCCVYEDSALKCSSDLSEAVKHEQFMFKHKRLLKADSSK